MLNSEKKVIDNLTKLKEQTTKTIISLSCIHDYNHKLNHFDTLYKMTDEITELQKNVATGIKTLEQERKQRAKEKK